MRHECAILADSPDALVELCGISSIERLLRTLQRCGLTRAVILSATPEEIGKHLAQSSRHRAQVVLTLRARSAGPPGLDDIRAIWPDNVQEILVLPGGAVFDARLLELLDGQSSPSALVDSAPPANLQPLVSSAAKTAHGRLCGPALLSRQWASVHEGELVEALCNSLEKNTIAVLDIAARPWHHAAMRRELHPYWFPAPAPAHMKLAERVLLDSAQKGTLDLPALVHAPIETLLIAHLSKTSITPNQLTVVSNIVAWGATILFATGRLAAGTVPALSVGVLDGLDGKQARVKVETSEAGKLEHWFDALFENSWWIALAYYFKRSGQLPEAFRYLLLLLAAEALGGLAKGSVIRYCGRSIYELGRFDRLIRLIGARRNVHIWILAIGVLLRAPAKAFIVIACWEAITAAIHLFRATSTLLLGSRNQRSERRYIR